MTKQMQRLLARVDGITPTVPPTSLTASVRPTSRPSRTPTRRRARCVRADWMTAHLPPEIEQFVVAAEVTDIRRDLAEAGLM